MATGNFCAKVAGVTMRNDNGDSRQELIRRLCKKGRDVFLNPEPSNPHDSSAIAVWVVVKRLIFKNQAAQIGYLEQDIAGEISRYMDKGGKCSAKVEQVNEFNTRQGKPISAVTIRIQKH